MPIRNKQDAAWPDLASAAMTVAPDAENATPLQAANTGNFGLLPAGVFAVGRGESLAAASPALPQALWFFRHETIATPPASAVQAGFSRSLRLADDISDWHARTPIGSATDFPPLVWVAAGHQAHGARLDADGLHIDIGGERLRCELTPRHPLNRAYFDAHSAAFLAGRPLTVRGDADGGTFTARTLWPEDFRLPLAPAAPTERALPEATAAALRARVREAAGGARSPFAVERLWQRPGATPLHAGQPVLGFILNGAQGDDDEAHGGHFAIVTGRIGANGGIDDWLVANFYTLDAESEKGIVAAPVPLDNYLADLNAGQSWYRPSYLLVATLRDPRIAAHVQSALGRAFNQYYRHQFGYHHACANCAGISVDVLRALGWRIPAVGPESWLRALAALPLEAAASGRIDKGKAAFDYLTEERTRLYPAVAFEAIGTDLLQLAQGTVSRDAGDFEKLLGEDVASLLFVRIPQLPSSRDWGMHPVVDSREYGKRMPRRRAERRIVPVGPRPFPADFVDPQAPREPLLRSDYAVAAWTLLLAGLILSAGYWLLL